MRDYGWNGDTALPEGGMVARVTAVYGERFAVVCEMGETYARLKGAWQREGFDTPTTGDFLAIRYNPSGDSMAMRLLPRRSQFLRSNFMGHAIGYAKTIREQVVAANFDTVFVMQSLNADFSARRLERYLALAWRSGAEPVVALTKADLCSDVRRAEDEARLVAAGAPVLAISVVTDAGMAEAARFFTPARTIVFLGSSGVGKSTLLNALAGREIMDTAGIRACDDEGRHTTTRRQMVALPNGALVIDTPGMREIGLFDAGAGIERGFPDVEEILGKCRFSDCRHAGEPGCAVEAALRSGALSQERWQSYLALRGEDAFVKRHANTKKEKLRAKIGRTR